MQRAWRRLRIAAITLCGLAMLVWPASLVVSAWPRAGSWNATITDHRLTLRYDSTAEFPPEFELTQPAWARLIRREAWSRPTWDFPEWEHSSRRATGDMAFQLWLPLPPLALAAALLAGSLMLVPAVIRRRRLRAGGCLGCGYSLAGLDAARCPECGAATPAAGPGKLEA